jgi:hypothetical protein
MYFCNVHENIAATMLLKHLPRRDVFLKKLPLPRRHGHL